MAGHPLTSFDFGGSPAALAPPPLPPDTPPGLVARLRESFLDYPGGLLYPPLATFDDAPNWPAGWGRGATGAVGDRRAGRDLPKFWSELDLRAYRVMSRWLWDTNPFMIGFGGRLVDYHVRKGFQWQACLKGQKKMAYATASNQKQTPDGAIVEKAQNVLDAWRDAVDWPLRSREGFRRLRRDGEVCQRFGVASRGELPWVRWVNPEQVGSPVGETDGVDSYGVRTGEGDTEHVTALHVWDHDDQALRGEWVNADPHDPAARLVFAKTNTDADVKRGLPDSFSLHECMDEARKVVRNMVVSTAPMAAQSWREKFATATGDQVRGLIPTTLPDPRQAGWPQSSPTIYSDRMLAGTVVRVEGNREFEPGPTATGAGSFVEVVQAALRTACVRWGLPPYMTAKADDINFASSLTAGSPFAVAVEGGQVEWSAYERRTALKVLDLAVESGLLTREERGRLDVHVVEPTVVTPDPAAATARRKTLLDAKVVDPYTVMQEEGYDPSHIEANWKAWNERNPQQPPPGQQPGQGGEDGGGADGPGGGDGGGEDPLAGLLGESVARPGDLLHLMAAVLAAHARGGAVDADAVAELAGDPDALADAVDEAGGTVAESVRLLLEKWAGFKTRRGTVGATDGTRKVYGQRAKDLLAAQDRTDKGEPAPEHPARKLAQDLKAGREPARDKARQALSAALADPAKVRPEHVTELAAHLPALTRDEARNALRALGKKAGGMIKADIVKGLLDHIAAGAAKDEQAPGPDATVAAPASLLAAVRAAHAAATGLAKDHLDAALENAGVSATSKTIPDPKLLYRRLASEYGHLHRRGGTPADLEHLATALRAVGAEQVGTAGAVEPFDGARHEADSGISTGTPVRVVRAGWRLPDPKTGGSLQTLQAKVEPASQSPTNSATGVDKPDSTRDTTGVGSQSAAPNSGGATVSTQEPIGWAEVTGNSFPHMDAIRAAGGVWDSGNRVWRVPARRAGEVANLPGVGVSHYTPKAKTPMPPLEGRDAPTAEQARDRVLYRLELAAEQLAGREADGVGRPEHGTAAAARAAIDRVAAVAPEVWLAVQNVPEGEIANAAAGSQQAARSLAAAAKVHAGTRAAAKLVAMLSGADK